MWLECSRCLFLLFPNLWSTKRNLWFRCALKSPLWWPRAVQSESSWLHSHSFHLQLPVLWSVRFIFLRVSHSRFIKFWLKNKNWWILWTVCASTWWKEVEVCRTSGSDSWMELTQNSMLLMSLWMYVTRWAQISSIPFVRDWKFKSWKWALARVSPFFQTTVLKEKP